MNMDNQIYTIPVQDALREPGSCPFCAMYTRIESGAVAFIIGPAYMEDDVREQTNRLGFCARHMQQLYDSQNRLGLSLMLHSRLQALLRDMEMDELHPKKKPSRRLKTNAQPTCYVCREINETFVRYMDTFFYLWKRDKEAAALIKGLPGFCMPHYRQMMQASGDALNKQQQAEFIKMARSVQRAFMQALEADLDWFIRKFDYRYAEEPWNNAQDALIKAMALYNQAGDRYAEKK